MFWLIDPDGGRFLSKGVNTVRFDQDEIQGTKRVPYAEACRRKYGGIERLARRGGAAARAAGASTRSAPGRTRRWRDAGPHRSPSRPTSISACRLRGQKNEQNGSGRSRNFPTYSIPLSKRMYAARAR